MSWQASLFFSCILVWCWGWRKEAPSRLLLASFHSVIPSWHSLPLTYHSFVSEADSWGFSYCFLVLLWAFCEDLSLLPYSPLLLPFHSTPKPALPPVHCLDHPTTGMAASHLLSGGLYVAGANYISINPKSVTGLPLLIHLPTGQ